MLNLTHVDEPAPPPIGHNNPPQPLTVAEIGEHVIAETLDLAARREELLAGVARFHEKFATISDDETCGKASDFAGGKGAIAAWLAKAETKRVELKEPFLTGGRIVDGFFKELREPLEAAQKAIRAKATIYLAAKEEAAREAARKEAEAAARRAAEAERAAMRSLTTEALDAASQAAQEAEQAQAHADAAPAEHSRVYGHLGTTMSLRAPWKADYSKSNLMELVQAVAAGNAPLEYLTFNETRINYAIKSEKVRDIPGVHIGQERSAV